MDEDFEVVHDGDTVWRFDRAFLASTVDVPVGSGLPGHRA